MPSWSWTEDEQWRLLLNETWQPEVVSATPTGPSYAPRSIIWFAPDPVERERREAARVLADSQATAVLLGVLTPEQRASYKRDHSFRVVGSVGGLYRIRLGTAGNVDWFAPGDMTRPAGVLCAHPDLWDGEGYLPEPDVALAQLLALTTDEAGFVRVANVHRGRRPAHVLA